MRKWRELQFFIVLFCCWAAAPSAAEARDRWLARTTDTGKECWVFTKEQVPARTIGGPYKTKREAYKQLCEQVKQGKDCDSMQYTNPVSLCREYEVELN